MGIIIAIFAPVGTQSGFVGRKYGNHHHHHPCPHGPLLAGMQEPIQAGTSSPRGTQTPWTIPDDVLAIKSQTLPSPCSASPQGRSGTARTDVENSLLAQLRRDRQDLTESAFAPGGISHCQDLFLALPLVGSEGQSSIKSFSKEDLELVQDVLAKVCRVLGPHQ